MRKWRWADILTGVLLTVAVFSVGFSFGSFDKPTCDPSNCGAQPKKAKGEQPESIWQATFADPVAFYGAWVALFTGALGISTWLLWRATNRTVDLAREEFNATHRARIRILSLMDITGKTDNFATVLRYVDVGDIGAQIDAIAYCYTMALGAPAAGLEMDIHAIGAKIASGIPQDFTAAGDEDAMMQKIAVDIGGVAAELLCVGYVQYSDASGIERRTGFCFKYAGNCAWSKKPDSDYAYEY